MTTTLDTILIAAYREIDEHKRIEAAAIAERERAERVEGRRLLIERLPILLPFLAPYFDPEQLGEDQNEIDLGGIVVSGTTGSYHGMPVSIDRLRCPGCGEWVGWVGGIVPNDGAALAWFGEGARGTFEWHDDAQCPGPEGA